MGIDDLPAPPQGQANIDDLPAPDGASDDFASNHPILNKALGTWHAFHNGLVKNASFGYLDPDKVSAASSNPMISAMGEGNEAIDQANHPAEKAGELGGSAVGAELASPILGMIPGLSALSGFKTAEDAGRLANTGAAAIRGLGAGVKGAVMGFAENPNSNSDQGEGFQLQRRLGNALTGAETAAGLNMAGEGLGLRGGAVEDSANDYAIRKGAKAIGLTKAQYKKILEDEGPEGIERLVRPALDDKIITPLATPEKIAQRAQAAKEAAGEQVGDLLDDADQHFAGQGPVGFRPAGTVQASPVQQGLSYGKPVTQSFYSPPPSDIPAGTFANQGKFSNFQDMGSELQQRQARLINAKLEQANAAGYNPYAGPDVHVQTSTVSPTIEKAGAPAEEATLIEPIMPGRVDGKAIAQQLRSSPEIAALSKTPGKEGTAARVDKMLQTLEDRGSDLTLREAQQLRQGIDESINFNKPIDELRGAQPALYDMRDAVRDKMNGVVNQYATEAGIPANDPLLQANQKYGTLSDIEKFAGNRAAMNAANRSVGLTDTIAGGAGGTVGGVVGGQLAGVKGAEIGAGVGATAGGMINKLGRTYGPSLQATSANQIAKIASVFPELGKAIEQNPALAPRILDALGVKSPIPPPNVPPVLQSLPPEMLNMLQKNPGLIDTLSDENLKAQLHEALKRMPASQDSGGEKQE